MEVILKTGDEITLSIHGLGSSGEGAGYYDGYTVFVDGALPGETVRVRLSDCRKKFGFAQLVSILNRSPHRVKPPCPLFGKCGGCQIMHLSYDKQLEAKKQKVIDALKRIGKIDPAIIQNCISSPLRLGYRNKIQLPVCGTTLGLYAKNSHDLISVDHCLIHCDLGEETFQKIKDLLKKNPVPLRHVLIKSAISTKQALVILVTKQIAPPLYRNNLKNREFGKDPQNFCSKRANIAYGQGVSENKNYEVNPMPPKTDSSGCFGIELAKQIMREIPNVQGVIHNIHTGKENVILGDIYHTLVGKSQIFESLCGLTFSISAASFFQVNPMQAENLYLEALELAKIEPTDTVLDAYCGVGTLSLIFAKLAKKVIGVECVREAIVDARENALRNNILNVEFTCANSEEFIHTLSDIDVLLMNPPRKGADPAFLEGVKRLSPKKIIYISCDPATLARDLAILEADGFKTKIVQPFDMFPQTAHVESIALLQKFQN